MIVYTHEEYMNDDATRRAILTESGNDSLHGG